MANQPIIQRNKHHGFNLIEAAIVLGIVGLVIGGIWIAASAVNENNKVNQTIDFSNTIVTELNNLYKNMPRIGTATVDMSPLLISKNIIPPDKVVGSTIKSPFGGDTHVTYTVGPDRIRVSMAEIPESACTLIISRMSAISQKNTSFSFSGQHLGYLGLFSISVWGSSMTEVWFFGGMAMSYYSSACKSSTGTVTMQMNYYFPAKFSW